MGGGIAISSVQSIMKLMNCMQKLESNSSRYTEMKEAGLGGQRSTWSVANRKKKSIFLVFQTVFF